MVVNMDLVNNLYILDGGLATEIERRGHTILGDPLWSARLLYTHPEVIQDVHKCFLDHDADIIITASYQTSVGLLCENLNITSCESLDLIGRSVSLARKAVDEFMEQPQSLGRLRPLVAGSIGPYGACLCDGSEYTGNYIGRVPLEVIKEWHKPRIHQLIESGVDLLAIETFPSQKEAEVVIEVLNDYPDIKCWVSFACKDEVHTCYGEVFADAVKVISQSPHVIAVGINCTEPQYVEPLLASADGCSKVPFVVYPNCGQDWEPGIGWHGKKTDILQMSIKWMEKGAKIIGKSFINLNIYCIKGGCCQVTPEEITLIKKSLDNTK
jgi:homocysteine S-methyltransferase